MNRVFIVITISSFILSIFFTVFLLMSNNNFIDNYLNKVEVEMFKKGEDVSDIIDMTETIIKSPGYRISISSYYTFTTLRNFFLLYLLVFISMSFILERFIKLNEYLAVIIYPLWIMVIGFWVNFLLRLYFFDLNTITSLGSLIKIEDNRLLMMYLKNTELFSFFFLISTGIFLSKGFKENLAVTFTVTFGNYLLLVGLSFLLNFNFSLL